MKVIEKKNVVHRNLMAGNIMIGEKMTVKIGGFSSALIMKDGVYRAHEGDTILLYCYFINFICVNGYSIV